MILLSLLFYAWGEAAYVPLLLGSAVINSLLARWAAADRQQRAPVVLAAIMNLALLIYYKYAGFLLNPLGVTAAAPALPLGISFFTFQGLSYVIDAHRGEETGSVLDGCVYICLFPQLVAGPIVRFGEIRPALRKSAMTWDGAAEGLRRFIVGLSKKVLLADTLAKLADAAFACPANQRGAALAWAGIAAFCLQLYLDFSGYSDMAVGLGKMLGFSFPENFRHPFRSASMRAFWRRWHVTLGRWFRDYVYIPMGGSRRGWMRTVANLLLVFALTGLWHGAGWTFLLWGVWNGCFVVLEHGGILKTDRWPRFLAHGYTLLMAMLGFVLFRAESLPAAGQYFASLTHFGRPGSLLPHCTPDVMAAFLIALPVSVGISRRQLPKGFQYGLCFLLLILCMAAIAAGGYHPFLYFRF